ncbi:hypothetical protein LTR85_011238 [Meristemomyces frigidus]|nr:hypothetical protein LTR85_011238 [Meristemomyces frigidus]
MGQYWKITNIDKAQTIGNEGGLKVKEILINGVAEPLVDLLKVPRLRRYKFTDAAVAAARLKNTSSRLVALPQELIDAITAVVENDVDIICLALTSSYFFRLLAPAVTEAVIRDEAPWAGDRIICVGDYANGAPAGLFTDDELAEITARCPMESEHYLGADGVTIETRQSEEDKEFAMRNPLYSMETQVVNDAVSDNAVIADRNPIRRRRNDPVQRVRRLRNRRLSVDEMQMLDRLLHPSHQTPRQEVILRNLTTKEYVLDSAVAGQVNAYGLGEVLCTHTQWGEGSSHDQRLRRKEGEWAGCRFDIATMREVDGSWTDVSEKALRELGYWAW